MGPCKAGCSSPQGISYALWIGIIALYIYIHPFCWWLSRFCRSILINPVLPLPVCSLPLSNLSPEYVRIVEGDHEFFCSWWLLHRMLVQGGNLRIKEQSYFAIVQPTVGVASVRGPFLIPLPSQRWWPLCQRHRCRLWTGHEWQGFPNCVPHPDHPFEFGIGRLLASGLSVIGQMFLRSVVLKNLYSCRMWSPCGNALPRVVSSRAPGEQSSLWIRPGNSSFAY